MKLCKSFSTPGVAWLRCEYVWDPDDLPKGKGRSVFGARGQGCRLLGSSGALFWLPFA